MHRSDDRVIGKSGDRALWTAILSALLAFGTNVAFGQTAPPQQATTASVGGSAPEGIPRDLARVRTQQLKDVRYELSYTIHSKDDHISGFEELHFVEHSDSGNESLWLDFREGSIQK